jgi:glycosyltransferase involved in cell wall biosynthesis
MPKLAIIDHAVSAGGVERFLHGLIGGAIECGVLKDWEIVLVRSRLNSANLQVPWPAHLQAENLHITYLGDENRVSEFLDRLAKAGRLWGIRGTGRLMRMVAAAVRSIGPTRWRAYCGETRCWIENYVSKNDFEVVYFSYPYFLEPPRLKNVMVATPHDFIFKYGLSVPPSVQRLLDAQMARWLKACAYAAVSSQFVVDDLKRFYPAWGSKAQLIRPGIPSAERVPTPEEAEQFCRSNGLPAGFILVVGWIVEHKNQKVVFEAVAKLRNRGLSVPLVCVGPNSSLLAENHEGKGQKPTDYLGQIVEYCANAGLKHKSDYFSLGYVNDFELECLYRSASMLIVPTLVEAGSFPAMEAMRAGCPVVFSQTPVYQEMIDLVRENAWMFPPHDSDALSDLITGIIADRREAHRRAMLAKDLVCQIFSWKRAAHSYFSLFEAAAGLRSATEGDAGLQESAVATYPMG